MSTNPRCKNCRLWLPYKGNEPTMPANSSKACMLRLHEKTLDDGEVVHQPSLHPDDITGPRYGERTGPNDTCQHFVQKQLPITNPRRDSKVADRRAARDLRLGRVREPA